VKRLTAALLAALCLGCPKDKPARAVGLHVPIPDGWEARARGGALEAGPKGHALLTLESRDVPLPAVDELVVALTAEGVAVAEKESSGPFVGVRYELAPDAGTRQGFVAVKNAGVRTVWCASTLDATPAQVREGFEVCRGVTASP
jgi:hypothetical protein